MTVFNTFIKVVKKYKFIIILYTVMLVAFAGFNLKTSDSNVNFVSSKPDVLIVNNDKETLITSNLISYIEKNSNIVDVRLDEDAINDALFYRDVSYIIYIPENYTTNFLSGLNPEINIKSTGDYDSSYTEMLLTRYIKVANVYQKDIKDENELINKINEILSKETQVEITSKLDTDTLSRATFYYNFLNYSLLAGCVYVICIIISSFREEKLLKRTIISSMNYKRFNTNLIISNGILAMLLWILYVILSFVLIGKVMLTAHGFILIANSFIFLICCVAIAFLIANLVNNKNAINGIINVIGLGSSFLCGAFVPIEWLPDNILKIAHILPSYWYIQTNELVKKLEIVNLETLKPVFINMLIILIFAIIFIIITNFIASKKRRLN